MWSGPSLIGAYRERPLHILVFDRSSYFDVIFHSKHKLEPHRPLLFPFAVYPTLVPILWTHLSLDRWYLNRIPEPRRYDRLILKAMA